MGNSQSNVSLTEAKVVFASGGAFPYSLAAEMTRKELEAMGCKAKVRIVVCAARDVVEHLSDADVLVPFDAPITAGVIARAPVLKLIMQFGNDVSNVDVAAATEAGIDVSRIKSNECGIAESCAEFAVFLALSLIFNHSVSRGPGPMLRSTLCGKNVIVFGGGAVASCLGIRLKGMGCNVMPVTQNHPENYKYLPDADILFLCLSRAQVASELVNAELLSAMKSDIHIVDISRGGLVNYADVLAGLSSGQIAGFAMDSVPQDCPQELQDHPRTMLSEHRVAATEVVYKCISSLVARNIARLCDGQELTDLVAPPTLNAPDTSK